MEYCLIAEGLCRYYGRIKAVDGLNLRVPRGAVYGLAGRNGSGKTTLLRIFGGLQEPTSGAYSLFGVSHREKDIWKSRRRMGFLVESPSHYKEMTAEENLFVRYKLLGIPPAGKIAELLHITGLDGVGKKKVGQFSAGMKQRLGIAMALAGDPDAILLDEPFRALDPEGIIDIRELLLKLNRERGTTILVSSHILGELSRLASHYGFLEKGRIVKEMTAEEVEFMCRKSLFVRVSDIKILSTVLEEFLLDYRIMSETEARIFSDVNIPALVLKLSDKGCKITDIRHQDESLESFFMRLLGGCDIETGR